MSKLCNMRGIEIKKFRAVSSGLKTLDELFGTNGFDTVWVKQHILIHFWRDNHTGLHTAACYLLYAL